MGYITTNIRLEEEDYLALKAEAARNRKSLSAVIREKVGVKKTKKKSPEELMRQIRRHAIENAKYTKGFNSLKTLREIRDEN